MHFPLKNIPILRLFLFECSAIFERPNGSDSSNRTVSKIRRKKKNFREINTNLHVFVLGIIIKSSHNACIDLFYRKCVLLQFFQA